VEVAAAAAARVVRSRWGVKMVQVVAREEVGRLAHAKAEAVHDQTAEE